MRKLIKYFITALLAALIVIAGGGLNVFIHYCSSHNTENLSLYYESESSCCEEEHNTNCCSYNSVNNKLPSSHDGEVPCSVHHEECCKVIQKFIKIEDDYLLSVNKVTFFAFPVLEILMPEKLITESDEKFTDISRYLIELPPLLPGKILLFFLHQFKIAPPNLS